MIAVAMPPVAVASAVSSPRLTVADILEVSDLSGLAVSPNGRFVAVRAERPSIAGNRVRLTWYVVPIEGGRPVKAIADGGAAELTNAGLVAPQLPIWSADSRSIYFRASVDGATQVWRAWVGMRAARPVTHEDGDVRDLAPSPGRRSLIYHVGPPRAAIAAAEREADDDGVLVDESVDIAKPILNGGLIDSRPATQRLTGSWFSYGDILWRTPLREHRLAVPGIGDRRSSGDHTANEIATVETGSGSIRARLDGGTWVECQAPSCRQNRIDSAILPRDGGTVLVTTSDRATAQTLSLWRPRDGSERRLASATGLLNGGIDRERPCATAVGRLVCVEASATSPPRLVTVDLTNGETRTRYDPNRSLRDKITIPARRLDWTADGAAFTGQLLLPTARPPATGFPLVMTYYDCPGFLRGGVGDEVPLLPLASHGIAALCITQATDPPGAPDAVASYARAVSGVRAIIDLLAAEGLVDPRRVGMSGLSYGSEIVMAAVAQPHLLAAAAVSTGLLEPGFYWTNDVAGRDTAKMVAATWQLGPTDDRDERWRQLSPALHTDRIATPLLMQLPEHEARWSMEFYAKMTRSPVPIEVYAFAHEGHIKALPRHKRAVYERNLDWFRFWLLDETDPAPVKRPQYARWQALRSRWIAAEHVERAHP